MKKTACDGIGVWVRKGIRRMLEVLRRWGPQFLTAFVTLIISITATLVLAKGDYIISIVRFLSVLAGVCFVILIIALIYDVKDGRRKDRETNAVKNHEALKGSFKRLHPEWTDNQVEIAATDTPPAPPIEGEEGWVSPRETYRKSCRKKK